MSYYGLTPLQISLQPWGIKAALLEPSKTVTDTIYPSVYLSCIERLIIDSSPFQHLRRVRQLGMSHEVYPGTTHNRFIHSLGTLRRAQDLLDAIFAYRSGLDPLPDYFAAKQAELSVRAFDTLVAKITVLTRLGALLHDIGHISYGHTIEDNLGLLTSHDSNEFRLNRIWNNLPHEELPPTLTHHLRQLILSKNLPRPRDDSRFEFPFVDDLINNNVCADLLDYVIRDHTQAGLPVALGERFLSAFYVSVKTADSPPGLVLQAYRKGRYRKDLVEEAIKLLRYRYEETDRILFHHTKIAADAMLGHLVSVIYEVVWRESLYSTVSSNKVFRALVRQLNHAGVDRLAVASNLRARKIEPETPLPRGSDRKIPRLLPIPTYTPQHRTNESVEFDQDWFTVLDNHALQALESIFQIHGDDGLLEWVAYHWAPAKVPLTHVRDLLGGGAPTTPDEPAGTTELRRYASNLARSLLDRKLYKEIGVCTFAHDPNIDPTPLRRRFMEIFGNPTARMEIEYDAAQFMHSNEVAGLLLWVPDIDMQLKSAMMPVNMGNEVIALSELHAGSNAANAIAEDHRGLWSLRVFVHPNVYPRRAIARNWLTERLGKRGVRAQWSSLDQEKSLFDIVLDDLPDGAQDLSRGEIDTLRREFESLRDTAARSPEDPSTEHSYDDLLRILHARIRAMRDNRNSE